MKRLALVTISVLFALIAILLVAPSFIDLNSYKPQISKAVEEATGYRVDIAGNIKLALIPAVEARIDGLSVSLPESKEPFLGLKRADAQLSLAPLLQKKISVTKVSLVEPIIRISKRKDGTFSFMTPKLEEMSQGKAQGQAGAGKAGFGGDVAIDAFAIENGAVAYTDEGTGQVHEIAGLNTSLRMQSLKGPFEVKGDASYNGQPISFEGQTEGALDNSGAVPVRLSVKIPQGDTSIQFGGVIDTQAQEVQGETNIQTSNLQAAGTAGKIALPATLKRNGSLKGTIKANTDRIVFSPFSLNLADFQAKGAVDLQGLQDKNPVRFDVVLDSDSVLAADDFIGKKPTGETSDGGSGSSAGVQSGPVPETFKLPFPMAGRAQMSFAAVRFGGQAYQGVSIDALVDDKSFKVASKIQKAPGDMAVDSTATLKYASASRSKDGAVIYADPALAIAAKGRVGSISKLAQAYNIKLNEQARTIQSANFDILANLKGDQIAFSDSTLVLDDTRAALSGYYKPGAGGRDKIGLDVSADSINLDKFIPQKAEGSAPAQGGEGLAGGAEAAKKFSLPFDADFDISVQKAQYRGQTITGLRLQGDADAKSVRLKQAGVQDYLGTAVTTKGSIADVPNLSGIDLNIYAKSSNVQNLMKSLDMKVEGLPASIGAAEAVVDAKGSINNLTFASNIKALDGQVDAKGTATGLTSKPQFSNMELGIVHPNFVKAMQILNPEFKAGTGLQQKIDLHAKVNQSGDVYTLSDINGSFGPMPISGVIKAVMGGGKPSIDGGIALGTVPLDTFLGSERAEAARKSGGGGAGAAGTGQRWSTRPLNFEWINSANVTLDIEAKGVNYGGWAFVNPTTRMVMGNGALQLQDLKAGLFGGNATVNTTLKPLSEGGFSIMADSTMSNVGIEPLVYAMTSSNKLKASGNVSMTMAINAGGKHASGLVNSLAGKASVEGREVVMEGFDLARLARALSADIKPGDSVQNLLSGVQGGTTKIDTIDGVYDIQSGIVNITSMVMDGPAANIASRGNVSVPQWTIDTVHTITLKDATDDVPAFDVAIKGPLDNPGNTFGKGILNDFVQRKIQRKLAKEAEKFLGDKAADSPLGGVINQILGGGQQQGTPESQTPAAGDEGAAQPQQQPAQQPQQQPAPEEQQEQEMAPEEQIIRGVLDGLLR